ncbi:MAG: hypothetical protein E7555_00945 [Ruminococcaceae bacterium]|nr:hypothetical protein [Oscillospiraceae bacterium]
MNNQDLQNMIEKYKKELVKYAEENGGYVNKEALTQMPESEPVVSVVSSPDNTGREADITELEGTNPDSFNAGRREPVYRNVDEFRARNRGEGTMRVQAFSGQQAFPVVNANVVISKNFTDGTYTFFDDLTDTSGIIDNMSLTAPESGVANEDNEILPYSTYTIRVTHPFFRTTVYNNVPVFDGITSIQPVNLVPKTGTPIDDNDIVYNETEPVDL